MKKNCTNGHEISWISDFLKQELLFRVVNCNGISIRTTQLVKKVKNKSQILIATTNSLFSTLSVHPATPAIGTVQMQNYSKFKQIN